MARPSFLLVSIVEHSARGLPNRALILLSGIRNPNPDDLYVADAWLEVCLPDGRQVAGGKAVTLLDQDDFIELLIEHYEKLEPEFQAMIPLKRLNIPVEPEE